MVQNPKGGGLSHLLVVVDNKLVVYKTQQTFGSKHLGVGYFTLVLILLSNSMISRPGTVEDSSLLSDEAIEEIILKRSLKSCQNYYLKISLNNNLTRTPRCHNVTSDRWNQSILSWHGSCLN
ncbi:MAG: hypothetical protein CM15mP83_4230 [Flavobacteriaceae bacterium]|nr:MAG: hypothetical protein CM15mP83_4230 [Flavobacteriaceae bacterium]